MLSFRISKIRPKRVRQSIDYVQLEHKQLINLIQNIYIVFIIRYNVVFFFSLKLIIIVSHFYFFFFKSKMK